MPLLAPSRRTTCAAFATVAAAAGLVAVATPAAAADGWRPVIGTTLTGGGETLATVRYTDGTTQKVRSGGLIHLFGGIEYQSADFAVQATLGYHVDDTSARNGSVRFSRLPIEVLGFWRASERVRLGGGARIATSPEVSSSGAASSVGDVTFDSKLGLVLQGEYVVWSDRASVLMRYVVEDYGSGREKISGNHVGVGFSFRF
jgi:hypothetical protein